MALYDGFFDASAESYAETGKYDRAYETSDFTDYFAKVIGSGVCVHNNPDSFLVRLEGGRVVVSPGYLFIGGYWLKNDADYIIPLSGSGTFFIVIIVISQQNAKDRKLTSLPTPIFWGLLT